MMDGAKLEIDKTFSDTNGILVVIAGVGETGNKGEVGGDIT